jgi:hypothetical protein
MVAFVVADRKQAGAASDLFKLARRCESMDEFEAKCQMEEEWVLSDEAGQSKVVDLPKAWTQAKSDIKGAIKAGLDLTKLPSYHKMKVAKAEANAARKEANSATAPTREPRAERTVQQALADGEVIDAKTTQILPADLVQLVKFLDKLPQHGRARLVKQFTKEAKQAWDLTVQFRQKAGNHAATA